MLLSVKQQNAQSTKRTEALSLLWIRVLPPITWLYIKFNRNVRLLAKSSKNRRKKSSRATAKAEEGAGVRCAATQLSALGVSAAGHREVTTGEGCVHIRVARLGYP